ncbi:hypothetical protein DSO57_1015222 [Entomophthora muscae]|uniref:Uncharacterized protein n=2 Tax=Entomophthora muscae TaxID=34485 RepID=A0ACC2TSS3_9FUNG|nr:hypothetical protein DSO57_1015222 [Entomophthora muscae]
MDSYRDLDKESKEEAKDLLADKIQSCALQINDSSQHYRRIMTLLMSAPSASECIFELLYQHFVILPDHLQRSDLLPLTEKVEHLYKKSKSSSLGKPVQTKMYNSLSSETQNQKVITDSHSIWEKATPIKLESEPEVIIIDSSPEPEDKLTLKPDLELNSNAHLHKCASSKIQFPKEREFHENMLSCTLKMGAFEIPKSFWLLSSIDNDVCFICCQQSIRGKRVCNFCGLVAHFFCYSLNDGLNIFTSEKACWYCINLPKHSLLPIEIEKIVLESKLGPYAVSFLVEFVKIEASGSETKILSLPAMWLKRVFSTCFL